MSRRSGKKKRRRRPRAAGAERPPREPSPEPAPRARFRWLAIAAVGLVAVAALLLWRSSGGERSRPTADRQPASLASAPPPGEVRREPGLNVLLITVDTLRADALGAYGHPRAETPWMDRLADAGVRFDDAHAHNVLTLPSHANILSGLHPQEHGVRDNSGFRFPSSVPSLAEILQRQGYRTGAFVSAFPLDSRFGLARGFDVYEDSFVDAGSRPAFLEQERAGVETVELARAWLSSADDRPFFAWVHLYEPHFPYAPPEPWASRFRSEPYHGDVAAADAALAPLLDPLFAQGAAGDTLVVLTSDHGEALGEHGEATHGIFAYEEVLEVPLILYQPRLFEPRAVVTPARHVDLLPTILDALALPEPAGLGGGSLLPAAAGRSEGAAEGAVVYFEALSGQLNRGWAPLYGAIDRGWKYIDLPVEELYDLERDPDEAANLAASEPTRLERARAALEPFRRLDRGAEPSPESEEIRKRLAALGYLSADAGPGPRVYTADDDPKTLIGLDETLREVATLYRSGDLQGALARCRQLVRRRPGMRVAFMQLAQLERDGGNLEAAVDALRRALALHPSDHTTLALLASYLTQAGRPAEAVEITAAHASLERPDVEVLLIRSLALARARRPEDALATLRKAEGIEPSNPKVPVYLGTLYLMGGRRDLARAEYRRALELNPQVASAHSSLAILAVEDGRVEESLDHWRRAVAADSREHAKLLAAGARLWSAGRRAEARPLLELFLSTAPDADHAEDRARVRRMLAGTG